MNEEFDPTDVYKRQLERDIDYATQLEQDFSQQIDGVSEEETQPPAEQPEVKQQTTEPKPINPPEQEAATVEPETEAPKQQGGDQRRFRKPDGSLDMEALEQAGNEFDMAGLAGIGDAAIGLVNLGWQGVARVFGAKDPANIELPRFQNEEAQVVRDITGLVLPSMVGTGVATGYLKGVQATRVANQGQKLSRVTKLGQDVAFKKFAEIGLAGGVGAVTDYVAPSNARDMNATGTLKEMWPQTWGWVSDDIATLQSDSPEVKRQKNMKEGVLLSIGADAIVAFAKFLDSKAGLRRATQWIPENEKAKKVTKKLNNVPEETPEDVIINGAAKRVDELNELAEYNLSKSVDLDQPVFGYHDLYDDMEYGLRTSDEGGVLSASVDLVRIENNIDTVYGRLGSVFTESALKYGLDADEGAYAVIKGIGNQLTDAGRYGYKTSNGKYLSFAEIDDAGSRLAADLVEMDVTDMRRLLDDFASIDKETGASVLTSDAYNATMKAIKFYLKEYSSMDTFKAAAYTSTSLGGQISDFAEGARLMEGSIAVSRAQEQILDRIEFLTTVKAQTSYVRGRMLNLLNTKKANRFQKAQKRITNLITGEEFAETFEEGMSTQAREAKEFVDTLRNVHAERPEMLGPLMLAYEVTDGSVNSITKLNNYLRNTTGTVSKMFFDRSPDMPSSWTQGVWANIYNSVLSSMVTPLKAGASNSALLIERPVATFMGAALNGDMKTIRRGIYQYRAIGDTFRSAYKHMNEVYKRAAKDPTSVGYVMRDDIAVKNERSMEILNAFADAEEARGNLGPAAIVGHIEELQALERHPWLRFGPNAMTAFDGFTRSVIGSVEARGRAYDLINTSGGAINDVFMDDISKMIYKDMFDKNGMITDKAVEYASREIAMNLDGALTQSVNEILQAAPLAKPFLMFPRTSTNMLMFAGSHNPAALFHKKLSDFGPRFEDLSKAQVEELLTRRGLTYTDETLESTYNTVRAEMKGRKAIGMLAVLTAGGMFLGNNIRGNGHYDKETQRVRRDANWQPRTYRGLDGRWYSYDNLGAISDWLALTADIGDNIVDGTLEANTGEVMFNKLAFILASSVTSKSFMAGLEPMGDVFSGNPAALSRWGASFGSGLAPLSGLRNDMSRLLTPQLKEVEQELNQLIANRNPIAKQMLPNKYDYIDGGEIGLTDPWTRIWNTFSPWKVHDEISPEKQFLIDIEFDGRPVLSTNGKGVALTTEMKSAIAKNMGEDKIYRDEIRKIMNTTTGREFRKAFKEAQGISKEPLDVSLYDNVHFELERALRESMNFAIDRLSPEMRSEIDKLQAKQSDLDQATKEANLEKIRQINNY